MMFENGRFYLRIPDGLENHCGPSWGAGQKVGFERVYVAKPGCSAATINAKISARKHVVFTPGVYRLEAPIVVQNSGIVLLGVGFPTLIPTFGGQSLMQVGDVDGVRVA